MKITIKAILINETKGQKGIIDNMMVVFCTAIRYSFKRLLEGKQIKDLEKEVSQKYNLNIRQSKDAVENARQIISSQKELVKLNYSNYYKKLTAIERQLNNPNISEKKRNGLLRKLEKRQRKLDYYKSFLDTNTIPPVIFGTKKMFIKKCKGQITNKEWKDMRNNRIYSRGDKSKKGNPNLRVVIENNMAYLEISTLEKIKTNRAIKIKVPIYLPQKLSKKTQKINGINYRQLFLDHLETGQAYQVEVIKKDGRYYVHITFELPHIDTKYTNKNGLIGIDTNPNGFALTYIDDKGNYKKHWYLKEHELLYARSNRRENLCGELAKEVVRIAKNENCGIAVEDLKFKDDKDVSRKFARIKHQFIYSKLLAMLEMACYREGIELVKIRPQYTSIIGLYKYSHQYKLNVHNAAALVIARRSYKYKEKVPKLLKTRLVKNIEKFNKKPEWGRWSQINKIIKKAGGERPDLWLKERKQILGLTV